jgi:hypothetical protein
MSSLPDIYGPLDESSWWAVYTRHQHEKAVAQVLSSKGFEVFLPLYDSVRRWKDRNKTLSLPLFPCYVFVRGGLNRRLQVVTTPGIIQSSIAAIASHLSQTMRLIRFEGLSIVPFLWSRIPSCGAARKFE